MEEYFPPEHCVHEEDPVDDVNFPGWQSEQDVADPDENFPTGHDRHDPPEDAYDPAAQDEQEVDPAAEEEPAGQLVQPSSVSAVSEYFPASHRLQSVDPLAEYFPAGQEPHPASMEVPVSDAAFPAEQKVQDEAPEPEKLPAAQSSQEFTEVASIVLEDLPLGH